MSEPFDQLLDATVQHLERLQAAGVRYVAVAPETMAALTALARRPGPGRPAPVRRSPPPAAGPDPQPSAPSRPVPTPPALPAPTAPTPPEPAGPLIGRVQAADLEALRQQVLACQKCPNLVQSRTQVVFGVGDPRAALMFVGEAPGVDEDAQGEPFVGAAGQLLTKIILAMGFTRQTVFIANILKCRPDTPGQSAGNRKPTPAEMQTCFPFLLTQIEQIQPRVLVALGATAVEGLLGKTIGISRLRGHFQEFHGIPLMPTYHPAYLLRNQSLALKREVWEDMLQVLEKLGAPITDKQRSFFLKATR